MKRLSDRKKSLGSVKLIEKSAPQEPLFNIGKPTDTTAKIDMRVITVLRLYACRDARIVYNFTDQNVPSVAGRRYYNYVTALYRQQEAIDEINVALRHTALAAPLAPRSPFGEGSQDVILLND